MTFGSLFSGIGGMDLGLERAGMECRWQVEIDPFCQRVLEKHWPKVKRYGDISGVDAENLQRVDVIAGGFPCQDVSDAGFCAGLSGSRSSLWGEMLRCVCVVRPAFVLVENVAALSHRGLAEVLGCFSEVGYDAEWDCIPAMAFGARHFRNRLFIVAASREVDHSYSIDPGSFNRSAQTFGRWTENAAIGSCLDRGAWSREPGMARVAYGIPDRVDRLKGIGNGVFPAVAEWLGRRILAASDAQ